jgi:hypothetical protein
MQAFEFRECVVFYVKFDYFVRVTGKFLGVLAVSS